MAKSLPFKPFKEAKNNLVSRKGKTVKVPKKSTMPKKRDCGCGGHGH